MSKRQDERRRRQRVFYAEKRGRARGDLAATVQVNYDELRAEIRELPKNEQQARLRELNDTLRDFLADVRKSNTPSTKPAATAAIRKP